MVLDALSTMRFSCSLRCGLLVLCWSTKISWCALVTMACASGLGATACVMRPAACCRWHCRRICSSYLKLTPNTKQTDRGPAGIALCNNLCIEFDNDCGKATAHAGGKTGIMLTINVLCILAEEGQLARFGTCLCHCQRRDWQSLPGASSLGGHLVDQALSCLSLWHMLVGPCWPSDREATALQADLDSGPLFRAVHFASFLEQADQHRKLTRLCIPGPCRDGKSSLMIPSWLTNLLGQSLHSQCPDEQCCIIQMHLSKPHGSIARYCNVCCTCPRSSLPWALQKVLLWSRAAKAGVYVANIVVQTLCDWPQMVGLIPKAISWIGMLMNVRYRFA